MWRKCEQSYYQRNKEKILAYGKKYRAEHKKQFREYRKKYDAKHKKHIKKYNEEYYEKTRGKFKNRRNSKNYIPLIIPDIGLQHKVMIGNENYQIYQNGAVWSIRFGKWLKVCKTNEGYLQYSLCKDGKMKTKGVHRLIMENFILNRELEEGLEVHHKDCNPCNNSIENLIIVTKEQHKQYHRSKNSLIESYKKEIERLKQEIENIRGEE